MESILSRIKAITLDLDDTLWPVWPTIARAETALYAWLQTHAPRTTAKFTSAEMRSLRDEIVQSRPELHHDIATMRKLSIGLALERAGDDPSLMDGAWDTFTAERQRIEFYPDSQTALDWMVARYPLAAITNGNADVSRIGIAHYFKIAITAGAAGVAKPDAAIFHLACDHLQLAPHEVLHVGDDPHLDVVGGNQAGLRTAWINRKNESWDASHPVRPDHEFPDCAALVRYLDAQN